MAVSTPHQVEGFPPIAAPNARILILGSAPSVESLKQRQYYAHPRNSFWPILTTLLTGQAQSLPYPERAKLLRQHYISLWDVMKSCERTGSLDSSIAPTSIETNPFEAFFDTHREIQAIAFNGGKAEEIFHKRVLPRLPEWQQQLKRVRLPSTSPAMARLTQEQKLVQWRQILLLMDQP